MSLACGLTSLVVLLVEEGFRAGLEVGRGPQAVPVPGPSLCLSFRCSSQIREEGFTGAASKNKPRKVGEGGWRCLK